MIYLVTKENKLLIVIKTKILILLEIKDVREMKIIYKIQTKLGI